jgi:hypothetical protein
MHRRALSLLLILALLVSVVATNMVSADTCTVVTGLDFNCIHRFDFGLSTEGWKYNQPPYMALVVPEYLSGGNVNGTIYDGAIYTLVDGVRFYKTVTLPPGHYQVAVRLAAYENGSSLVQGGILRPNGTETNLGSATFGSSPNVKIFSEFELTSPGDVTLWIDASFAIIIDYVWVISSLTPTATPGAGTPTATSVPNTATPANTPTPYCVNRGTPTPGFPQSGSTATPTPYWQNDFTYYYNFDSQTVNPIQTLYWTAQGAGIAQSANGRGTSQSSSIFVPFSVYGEVGSTRKAIMHSLPLETFTSTVTTMSVDAWARASFVAQSTTAKAEIWYQDGLDNWHEAVSVTVGTSYWYALHAVISDVNGIDVVALVNSVSDASTVNGVYWDDVYFYGNPTKNAPDCNSWFITEGYGNPDIEPSGNNVSEGVDTVPPSSVSITVNGNKTCPADYNTPNNIWGFILTGLMYASDVFFGPFAAHEIGATYDAINNLISSPMGTMFVWVSILFDWTIPVWTAGILATLQTIYTVILVWKGTRRSLVQ